MVQIAKKIVPSIIRAHKLLYAISLFLVAFGQPSRLSVLCPIVATMGYALLWFSLKNVSLKSYFSWTFIWFFIVQLCWHSWLSSTKYQGVLILIIYTLLCALFALQFAVCSVFLKKEQPLFKKAILIGSLWTLSEMVRVFILSGFLWSPVGLALSCNSLSLQLASIGGVYFLSFWVIFTNVVVYGCFTRSTKIAFPIITILIPYLFGLTYQNVMKQRGENFSVILVQTGLYPEEKNYLSEFPGKFIRPEIQWKRIFQSLVQYKDPVDLLVLPEAALPFGSFYSFLPFETFEEIWEEVFKKPFLHLSLLKSPYAIFDHNGWKISNAFINQALSHEFNCEVICGLDYNGHEGIYNSALFFNPDQQLNRYDKQVLVPIGEYIPFDFLRPIAAQFGIFSSFKHGLSSKVFSNKIPKSVSICMEEIYPMVIRESRNKGACMMVNVTNDGWFPETNLPKQHWDLGKIRAVENGVYVLRACNTGVTGVIDPFGKTVKVLQEDTNFGALFVNFPFHHHTTLYMIWGDCFMLAVCIFGLYACIKNQIKVPFFKV